MSVLQKLNDYIVEATEQALKVVEEGSAILMSGGMDSPQESNNDGTGDFDRDTDATTQEHSDFSGDIPEDYFEQGSPLNGLADNVLSDVMKNQAAPTSTWDNIEAFKSAITWSEPFILSLIAFHVLIILCTILATKRGGMVSRFSVMGSIFIVVRSAEKLNDYGSENWERFASQNYFDGRGVFVSLMVSAPLLFISAAMLIAILREATTLLIDVKTHELKAKAKAQQGGKRGKKTKKQD